MNHEHDFQPKVSFDWQDNALYFGRCECGETEG
jgi:hypothetical protein